MAVLDRLLAVPLALPMMALLAGIIVSVTWCAAAAFRERGKE